MCFPVLFRISCVSCFPVLFRVFRALFFGFSVFSFHFSVSICKPHSFHFRRITLRTKLPCGGMTMWREGVSGSSYRCQQQFVRTIISHFRGKWKGRLISMEYVYFPKPMRQLSPHPPVPKTGCEIRPQRNLTNKGDGFSHDFMPKNAKNIASCN